MRISRQIAVCVASLLLGSSLAAQEVSAKGLPVASQGLENYKGDRLSLKENARLTKQYTAYMASPSAASLAKIKRRANSLLKKDSGSVQAWKVLRGVAAQSGDIEAVIATSLALLDRGWPEQELYWQAAGWAHSVDRVDLARQIVEGVVDQFGASQLSANSLSNIYLSQGNIEGAFAAIEAWMVMPDGGAEGALMYNNVLLRIGRHEEAYVNASGSCRAFPSHLGLRMNLVRSMMAMGLRDSADAVIHRTFKDQGIRLSWKLSYLESSLKDLVSRDDVEAFQAEFNQLLQWTNDLVLSNQELAGPLAFKALVLAHMGLLEGAQTCWVTVLAMDDGNRFEYLDEAMKIDKVLNDWETLSNHSLIAMLRYPEKSSGYIYRGMSLTVLGDIDRAVEVYKQGIITADDSEGLKVLQSMLTSIEEALQQ